MSFFIKEWLFIITFISLIVISIKYIRLLIEVQNKKYLNTTIENKNKEIFLKSKMIDSLNIEINKKENLLKIFSGKTNFLEVSIFDYKFDFTDSNTYQNKIINIKEKQKELFRSKKSIINLYNKNNVFFENKYTISVIKKTTLTTFNIKADNYIKNVNYKNYNEYKIKIIKTFEMLNELIVNLNIKITKECLDLKLIELKLVFEKEEKTKILKEIEKENIRQIKEEEDNLKKFEKESVKAEKEEIYYLKLIKEKEKDLIQNHGKEILTLNKEIEELKDKLAIAQQNKLRAISMAQQTKAGFVYIISNIGSFGENIYKIGLTRRLDPMERISELSGASVPFKFNLHALIYSTNAPSLENELHTDFEEFRVNLINNKKEFFKIPTKEIKTYLKINYPEINFIEKPEAKDYIETLALQKDLKTDMYE